MNVRTIREVSRAKELAEAMRKQRVAVCGVQEQRRVHKEDKKGGLDITMVDEYQLITASAWRNEAQVILASFSNPTLTIVVAYAPTLDAKSEEKDYFYNDLRHAVEAVPVHNFLCILGDFNARIGQEDATFTYYLEKK
ncbi:uncharacterized protein LOC119731285 [Patiria miniata]|uniref:Craniofacial development protein 2-like n=1 Tax=Patiria miniata TaxID=46514 RepID=A0A914A9C2_PATMI|nr:uncharacterized protein LOC119731224 [Patiria miniata]XP_038060353.1 uncharacterized protein LOC119731285 [Patiria miniata]